MSHNLLTCTKEGRERERKKLGERAKKEKGKEKLEEKEEEREREKEKRRTFKELSSKLIVDFTLKLLSVPSVSSNDRKRKL